MFKKIAIPLIFAVLLAFGVGLALPRTWRVEQHIVIDAPPELIYRYLVDLRRWQDWSVWTRAMDPLVRNTYEGPPDGLGAKWLWLGPKMGRGRMEIVACDPRLGLELDEAIESEVVNGHASLSFSHDDSGTRVTWVDEGLLPLGMGGFFRSSVEELLAANFSRSLRNLKRVVEALPEAKLQQKSILDGGSPADGGSSGATGAEL